MLYISRSQSEAFLSKVAQAVHQPETHPIVFQVSGIGGVGKSTLLAKLQESQKQAQVVKVSFGETEGIDDPIQLMRKLHSDLEKQYPTPKGLNKDVRDILSKPDPFSKLYEQFADALYQLQTQSVDGKASVSDEQLKQVKQLVKEGVSGVVGFFMPGIASNTAGKAAELSVGAAGLLLSEKDRLLQQHPATRGKRSLQALMANPVPKLTQAFAESLVLRSKKRPIILILDTYEKAQPDIDRWLWQSLLLNTELQPHPIRLVVAGRYPLTRELEWRKLRDRQLLWEQSLERFDWKQTEQYLQEIRITSPDQVAAIWQQTKGLPTYLDWVRQKHAANQEFDFPQAGQAIEDLLLEGLSKAEKQVVRQAACCNWFDRRVIQQLLSSQEDRDWFEWLKQQHFVEPTQGHYRFVDVARDVLRQALWYDDRRQFKQTHTTLASYFEAEANQEVAPESPLSAKYKNSEWRDYRSEFLYHVLFARQQDVKPQVITHLLESCYFQEDIFSALRVNLSVDAERSQFLGQDLEAFLGSITSVLFLGLPLHRDAVQGFPQDQYSKDIVSLFSPEVVKRFVEEKRLRQLFNPESDPFFDSLVEEGRNKLFKTVETCVNTCCKALDELEGFAKFAALFYKSQWCTPNQQLDWLLQAQQQAETIATSSEPEYSSKLFSQIGYEFYRLEQFEAAIAAYDQALTFDPDNVTTWSLRGFAFAGLGQHLDFWKQFGLFGRLPPLEWFKETVGATNIGYFEAAVESFNRVLEIELDAGSALTRAMMLFLLGRFEDSVEAFDLASEIKPDALLVWYLRGGELFALGRHEKAIASFDQALAIDPDYLEAWNLRRLVPGGLGREEEAIASYDRALAVNPKNLQVLYYRGCALANLKRYEAALSTFDNVLKLDQDHHKAWSSQADVLEKLGRREDAITSYDKALKIDPNSFGNWWSRGLLLHGLGHHEEEVANYDKALAIAPHIAEIWSFRGRALGILKRYEDAIVSCDRAIALEADHSEAHRCRGGSLLRLHRYEEAIANLDKAIAINPDAYEAWGDRGFALWKLQRFEAAITSFDQAIAIKPDLQEADFWSHRGATLFMLNRLEEAIDSYDKVLQVDPDNYGVWYWRGFAFSLLERYEEAVTSYDRAIAVNPNDHEVWLQKIAALKQLGRTVEAVLTLKRALAINPDNPDLPPIPENLLEPLRNLRSRLEEADNPEELLRELGETGEIESLMSLLEETNEQADLP